MNFSGSITRLFQLRQLHSHDEVLFLDLFVLPCGGQSTTFADLLDDVFVHICIGSDVNIICPEPNL